MKIERVYVMGTASYISTVDSIGVSPYHLTISNYATSCESIIWLCMHWWTRIGMHVSDKINLSVPKLVYVNLADTVCSSVSKRLIQSQFATNIGNTFNIYFHVYFLIVANSQVLSWLGELWLYVVICFVVQTSVRWVVV